MKNGKQKNWTDSTTKGYTLPQLKNNKIKIFQSYPFANFNKIIPVNLEPDVGFRTPINSK